MSAEKVPPPIAVRVSWTCPTCRAANRVDEASDAITCTGCGTCHPMPAEAWTRMFRTVPERADPLGPGEESASPPGPMCVARQPLGSATSS